MVVSTTNDTVSLTGNTTGNKIFSNDASPNMKFLLEKQKTIYKSTAYILREPKTIPKTLSDFTKEDLKNDTTQSISEQSFSPSHSQQRGL